MPTDFSKETVDLLLGDITIKRSSKILVKCQYFPRVGGPVQDITEKIIDLDIILGVITKLSQKFSFYRIKYESTNQGPGYGATLTIILESHT